MMIKKKATTRTQMANKLILRHKFNAKPSTLDGIRFSSKKESLRYLFLKNNKDVLFFLRQVPFHLPGNVRYVVDFVIFWINGDITFEDVKGIYTPIYKAKKKIVEGLYPIIITEV